MRSGRGARRAAGGLLGAGTAGLLILASVIAGLSVPETQYLRGYPAVARLDAQRPPAGFVPLASRYISRVLGGPSTVSEAAAGRAGARAQAGAEAARPARRAAVEHAFVNDDFSQAYVVPAVPFTARTNTRAATREQGEPAECSRLGGTAWYRYSPKRDESLLATTIGSNYAVALAAFAGTSLDSAKAAGCANGTTGAARLAVRATKGETYYFQITGVAGGGDLIFNLDAFGRTERVSVSSVGGQANGSNYGPVVSGDGRYVAFHSAATNLTPEQPRCLESRVLADRCGFQVFVHDRVRQVTSLVSVSSAGSPGNGTSSSPSISVDGRYVAFESEATDLTPDSVPGTHIYLHDRATAITERVSQTMSGDAANGASYGPSISGDGRYVAFQSTATDLTADPPPPCGPVYGCPGQIFVRDRATGRTIRASQAAAGAAGNGPSGLASIAGDGTVVAFQSAATNLVADDTNGVPDFFARDLRTGAVERVSLSSTGEQADSGAETRFQGAPRHYVSGDGRYVAFQSQATNLVPGDTNGGTDFFVRDRMLGRTERVTLSSSGAQVESNPLPAPPASAGSVAISYDGRYVAFDFSSRQLADDQGRSNLHVYLRDRLLGTTTLVSVSSRGEPGDDFSMGAALPANAGVVVFSSTASNLIPGDSNDRCFNVNSRNNCSDIFVHEIGQPK